MATGSYPAVTGYPQTGSGGPGKGVPRIYSSKLNDKFYQYSVVPYIANTDHENEIRGYGDVVYIRNIADVSVTDYVKGQKLTYERPEAPASELVINKGKNWNCVLDAVDKWQSDINKFDEWSEDAAHQIKVKVDTEVLADVPALVSPLNCGQYAGKVSANIDLGYAGAPVQLTKNNVLDYILQCATVLDEQNIPEVNRWIVIPAWAARFLKLSAIENVYVTGDALSPIRNGRVGQIDRFEVYVSNCISTVNDSGGSKAFNVLFGHTSGITFAGQCINMEMLISESTYGTIIRGLEIYGYNVIKPDAVGLLYCHQ
ncbi:hypothetical protein [Candidatus Magnetominusculus xianensis]|uniref:Capsid protein n=1 Tax=Candidatus Magnetominusculus xianensis TaxID=1748249 RepID=A0ABR5SAT6_9BACT|nr:hypothetical protein [Candidatus Magnetominusculus xianensis]KWT73777.1 hypothetical protein ASN18_3359 [Candidatus Magnetominusculus xianensis]MBF0404798.1 hypothetical protein [Nitrospirota bacterium]